MREPLPPLAWAVSHWAEDPWAGGAWSGLLVGGTAADRARLGEPVGDRLVVAGEAVHSTWPAMAHGAYGSGVAAAERVDALARPGERMVVVGAGMAGLAAARTLARRDREVLVVEARDRLGGGCTPSRWGRGWSPTSAGRGWSTTTATPSAAGRTAGVADGQDRLLGPDGRRRRASSRAVAPAAAPHRP